MNETELRDARRAQLLGKAWLHLWQAQGRGKTTVGENRYAATWIPCFEEAEKPDYAWIWFEPYLTDDTDIDEYRGQSAGTVLLTRFSDKENKASKYYFGQAKANAGRDEWLFIPQVLEKDGWRKTADGGWTKAPR